MDVEQRRVEQIGDRKQNLCGVRLCGTPLRSCVGCEPNPVPGLEPCWPSWEEPWHSWSGGRRYLPSAAS